MIKVYQPLPHVKIQHRGIFYILTLLQLATVAITASAQPIRL